jgi:hypothetical protein
MIQAVDRAKGELIWSNKTVTFRFEEKPGSQAQDILFNKANFVFDIASNLFSDPTYGWIAMARGIFSSRRIAIVKKAFDAAKAGARKYLLSLGIPEEIITQLESTVLFDYSLLHRDRLTSKEMQNLRLLDQCRSRSPGSRFGVWNAFNTVNEGKNVIVVCPTTVALAALGNPKGLALILAHELGHTIDPCSLGKLQLSMAPLESQCSHSVVERISDSAVNPSQLPSDPTRRSQMLSFIGRVIGPGGFVDCLHRTGYVQSNGQLADKELENILANGDCLSEADQCYLRETRPGHPLASCEVSLLQYVSSFDQIFKGKSPDYCPSLQKAISRAKARILESKGAELMSLVQTNQELEAFPDFIAAGSALFEMNDSRWEQPLAQLSTSDRKADILTSLAVECWLDSDSLVDSHPVGSYRISVFSAAPRIRSVLECRDTHSRSTQMGGRDMISPLSCEDRLRFGFSR